MAESAANSRSKATRTDGVLCVQQPNAEWLSTGWNGGRYRGDRAYNISVPEGWDCTDLAPYVEGRLERAGFREAEDTNHTQRDAETNLEAPVLLTGVDLQHARGARCGPVTVYATAGVSNPAALPMEPPGGDLPDGALETDEDGAAGDGETPPPKSESSTVGTVNLIVTTRCRLAAGALENLLAVAAEAKAATLLAHTGFPGTTTDALVVGHDLTGPEQAFSGSWTPVGAATRACVREVLSSALESRYDGTDATIPADVDTAEYGVSTDVRASVFEPDDR
ncbi:adenosylcobinamide amidohydrolase [Halobacteria archaeon AArc-curdl1]|uniref:Adenosylcobinamide amidohydrolase n=1 Tax=Natronosalvus hydrolyticus TaxID=2979988 RepID=A0AAP3E5H3_9EURY|nr:adenosylcobinamide amidohydrolase [Halobacteria archaeon AArc-curdl1]